MKTSENADTRTVRGERLEAVFAKSTNVLTSLRYDGFETLLVGPQLNIWRAPTDNDGIKAWSGQESKPLGRWLAAGLHDLRRTVESFAAREDRAGRIVVEIVHRLQAKNGGLRHHEKLTFLPGGVIVCAHQVEVDDTLPDLPRIGVALVLRPGFERLRWFGNGPHESYPDRKRGTLVGLYESTVTEQYVPYIAPQEHGNKTDVRWFELREPGKAGLRIEAEGGPFEFAASHHHAEDVYCARHTVDLVPRPEIFVTIDHRQRGLGSASCGPDTLPKYQIPPGTYRFAFRVRTTV